MRSLYTEGAAPARQSPELESGKGGTAGTTPPVYGPPVTCRRQNLTASPNRPEGASRASMKKTLSFSFMSDRVNQRRLSAGLLGAAERQIQSSP